MSNGPKQQEHGVHATVGRLGESLRAYIEAQYHVRNPALIQERRLLLNEAGTVAQVPFIESTPVYELGAAYDQLDLPPVVATALRDLAAAKVGLFPRPYVHQAQTLQGYFGGSDLIVATGTGSGKTESFLMPIVGQLVQEARDRPATASLAGCRALLLYPMNALVNDQLGRIRRLFGDENASAIVSAGRGRPVRFGSYTGRSPYPGLRSGKRDGERIEPLFEEFYLPLMGQPETVSGLMKIGQWPSKDLVAFYGKHQEELKPNPKGGAPRRYHHWNRRLITQPGDREMMTRDETQRACPDILITNYSMLEYMLMRPIERSIFQQTRDWLHSNSANELILVLDEAHMYRGAGGAEVALLIRRLLARLDVPRERVRFILTSASLGQGAVAESAIEVFARNLTGLPQSSARKFSVITGTREQRQGSGLSSGRVTDVLAVFDLAAFDQHATHPEAARGAVAALAAGLDWPEPLTDEDLPDYLFANLTGFPVFERLVELVSGEAIALGHLQEQLFEHHPDGARALAALLALAPFARRRVDGRVLLPTRLHMFFRGLPGLYACVDPKCAHARHQGPDRILGRLHTHQRRQCQCGARVFELLTHRECGSAYLRAYADRPQPDFLWSTPSGPFREGHQPPLVEVEMLMEPPNPSFGDCVAAWLDMRSGRLDYGAEQPAQGFTRLYLPTQSHDWTKNGVRFASCCICGEPTLRSETSTIMDHATKGEAPFANLVKTQLDGQPASRLETRDYPNGGRKVLLFSDGRQKAARLARDIPREVEQDIFRQVLALATRILREAGREPRPERGLYIAVLKVLSDSNLPIFDGKDAQAIEDQVRRLQKDYADQPIEELLTEFDPGPPPSRYTIALLKQLCGRYYSLTGTTVGCLLPAQRALTKLVAAIAPLLSSLTVADMSGLAAAWLIHVADSYAFDHTVEPNVRGKAAGRWRGSWGSSGGFPKAIRPAFATALLTDLTTLGLIEKELADQLGLTDATGAIFIDPAKVAVHIDLDMTWYQCADCTALLPVTVHRHCAACGSASCEPITPSQSEYVRARKGFWRAPVERVLTGSARLRSISVEEHTAQLSNRDNARVHATTEQFELRFKDVRIAKTDKPIDVLSCTTTMEVGVDIGSLVAVGLRNVPPQRENYQQRAGRAGRRGSSLSTVLTYAQNGPHDGYYYNHPKQIVAGDPRNPDVKIDNPKIARRHIAAYLFQTFFHNYMDHHEVTVGAGSSALFRALGKATDFFLGEPMSGLDIASFDAWVRQDLLAPTGRLRPLIRNWLPNDLRVAPQTIDAWIGDEAEELLATLDGFRAELAAAIGDGKSVGEGGENAAESSEAEDERSEREAIADQELLEFLFAKGLLPSYAFPTDLSSFLVERLVQRNNEWKMEVVERPQQSIGKALSEYAPGRLIVINKETYRSGGVVANTLPDVENRAEAIFDERRTLVHCENCSFVADLDDPLQGGAHCPVCSGDLRRTHMVVPQVFLPEDGRALKEDDREQDITYATAAQFPVPVGKDDLPSLRTIGRNLTCVVTTDRQLVTVNKGQETSDGRGGFWICNQCGRASVDEPPHAPHNRPYKIEYSYGKPRPGQLCSGSYENVFLGHVFSTDLLLLRINLKQPLITDTGEPLQLRILEDALYSVAEGLRLAASRHRQIDLDPSEFGAGFRVVPNRDDQTLLLDVYLYDTLSGGAGYADLAARNIEEILQQTLALLELCPSHCETSCESCLRHYHNQYLKDRLDRYLGAELLRYALDGTLPEEKTPEAQANLLRNLRRLLELEGFSCESPSTIDGTTVPLVVRHSDRRVIVGLRPALLTPAWRNHSFGRLQAGISTLVLNEFILGRNLPDEHQVVRGVVLGKQ
ncbi:DEAD/DEAH box helicase [Mesorhizobium sp. B292B1B]|uniref:DEAD/DEAH box helicase n=2 Tax=Mesorhizobium TaxID=68287 RepID=UPI0011272473|nr:MULTISPECIES: DEAD/DEAH box helicase [unclassified Mesorhizobium]MCA0012899.1 DEAD/DEAH box helicase [Mesorhizobium sp. B294B1A1]MCA0037600.1 DEAD/DEAH box helicase [Mesorhizobium sp. B292B1B]TPM50706.1 DEAD/DEAH box helicase [Mesorhizobium sp. B2-3-2]